MFLVFFIMSQASATTATATTLPVTVLCTSALSLLMAVSMAPTLM